MKIIDIDKEGGYIKIWRKIINNPIWKNERLLKIWIWCLCKAAYKEQEVLQGLKVIKLKPGQFICSKYSASKELKFSPTTVYRYISFLKQNQYLDYLPRRGFSIISITNWEKYQVGGLSGGLTVDKGLSNYGQKSGLQHEPSKKSISNRGKSKINEPNNEPSNGLPVDYPWTTRGHKQEYKERKEIRSSILTHHEINFNFSTRKWENIKERDIKEWEEAYPACDINLELMRMGQWLLANPERRKKRYRRFITNWLSRAQEKGGSKRIIRKSGEEILKEWLKGERK